MPRLAGLLLVLALTLVGIPGADAGHGSMDNPAGTLVIPGGGSAEIPVGQTRSGDTLQWMWQVLSGSPAGVVGILVWTDTAGREQEYAAGPDGQLFGTFVAPDEFRDARLVWRNAGAAEVQIHWTYGASPRFWRRPDIFLPAMIPVILLVGCYVAARAIDRRARRHRRAVATVDPGQVGAIPGGET
jgi:hypothetical protein